MQENMDMIIYSEADTKIADSNDINVYLAQEYINSNDVISTLYCQSAPEPLPFYQTRDSLADMDRYKSFIDNCIRRFRKSRSYKGYKAYLMSMGLDRCQINGNIQDGMADIEMHHNFLTIYDITILISQHVLNTVGRCTTFDIVALLAQEHRNNNIPIVMLSETAHQLYHSNPDMYIPISMTFGKWWELLIKYRYGITLDIAYKVVRYITNCQANNELLDMKYYQMSNEIRNWGNINEYNYYHNYNNNIPGYNYMHDRNVNIYELNSPVESIADKSRTETGNGPIYTEAQIFSEGI